MMPIYKTTDKDTIYYLNVGNTVDTIRHTTNHMGDLGVCDVSQIYIKLYIPPKN